MRDFTPMTLRGSGATEINLEFISRQLERVLTDNASLRDDIRVLTAMMLRVDYTLTLLLDEVRAIHTQIGHMGDRVRTLEDAK